MRRMQRWESNGELVPRSSWRVTRDRGTSPPPASCCTVASARGHVTLVLGDSSHRRSARTARTYACGCHRASFGHPPGTAAPDRPNTAGPRYGTGLAPAIRWPVLGILRGVAERASDD